MVKSRPGRIVLGPMNRYELKQTQLMSMVCRVLLDFSLAVKAATLIFISGRGSAISSAKQG